MKAASRAAISGDMAPLDRIRTLRPWRVLDSSGAAGSPAAVVIRSKGGTVLAPAPADGSWRDITARQFAEDVTALAKGLIATGIAAGEIGRASCRERV